MEIGEKTNVYSLEVSMFGWEEKSSDISIPNPIHPYTEEDYSLHGRRITRSFWDYYKVTGTIDDSCYQLNANLAASETQGPGEAEFSMLRLKDLDRQRELFDDMESESSEEETTLSDDNSMKSRMSGKPRSASLDTAMRVKIGQRPTSASSYFREFIYDKTFDFLAYKHELRRAKLMEWCKERQTSLKIVGNSIEPPEEVKRHLWGHSPSNHSEFSRSLDDSESLFMLPYYLKPKEAPVRKILTISTLQLHRAINDRIQDDQAQDYPAVDQASLKESIKSSLPSDVFPFDKPRMKVVGGGGLIAKYESPFRSKLAPAGSFSMSSRTLPSHMTLRDQDLAKDNVHAEIRLDQISQLKPKIIKRAKKKHRKSRSKKNLVKQAEIDVMDDMADATDDKRTKSPQKSKRKRKLKKTQALIEDSFEEPKPDLYDQL